MSDAEVPDGPPELIVVLDAVDTELVAAFWAEALRYRRADPLGAIAWTRMADPEGNEFCVGRR